MRRIAILAIGFGMVAGSATAQYKPGESDEFRPSNKRIPDYIKEGYEVKGGNGQQIMLQKGTSLALCYFNGDTKKPGTMFCIETK